MQTISKLWGEERILWNDGIQYCMKVLTMQPGFQSSLHRHKVKHETFLVVHGCCDMEVNGKVRRFVQGDYQVIPPGTLHRFKAVDGVCTVVEASTPHWDDDVYREEDSRRIE